jgi:TRAP-type C4-dicarboxylate transport system permease small subunit
MQRFFEVLDRGVEWLVAAFLAVILMIALIQVGNRFVINSSLSWSEEAQIFGHIWVVFLGIPIALRRGSHLYIETYCDMLPARARLVFDVCVELLWAAFGVSLTVLGWMVASVAHMQESPGLEMPMSWPYGAMVVGGAYLTLVAARRLAAIFWRPA